MDSRSAYEPLEKNQMLGTVSRPSTGGGSKSDRDQQKPVISIVPSLPAAKNPGAAKIVDEEKALEFRAVETIEEFFRPELAKQDDINSQIFNTDFNESTYNVHDTNYQPKNEQNQAKPQRMGFPDMSYLDPSKKGAPVEVQQTFYK